ncbi:TetM/TetW/TetO/TetS family tetracycline resistance ribosomal protection protein [Paenibacillus silvisoli]|uniref:TetM/TetW/TetO/TetS family tetracycline resistance ribosomal protection protein n=1 Tax=Paenibacillus silvisoli TaxID=3110539 RepID=UPI002805E5A6|nr:TetM/TetW/TetO/TetS family tetracycline resistance ribosomal protection protein [Paenibacillus silvisoli]
MKTINIGILAHVDAGKTSLTERLLFETKVISEVGHVDKGNTQTDSMELERKRGITIKASVVSFYVNDLKINLIDTPGHADFIAEVERSLAVLDGVILVISGVEGVQAQTKTLMSVLKKLGMPTILFVNKIDRSGAQTDALIGSIKGKLEANVISLYEVEHIGTKQAMIVENRFDSANHQDFLEQCIELAALDNEHLLESYVNGEEVAKSHLKAALIKQTKEAKLYPIFWGSAATGMGVPELLAGVIEWFPANDPGQDAPLSGIVFKIEQELSGQKVAYVRVFSGTLRVRENVNVLRRMDGVEFETRTNKIKQLHVFVEGKTVLSSTVGSGDLGKVWGLQNVRIGDIVGEWSDHIQDVRFADPQMETRIEAVKKEQNHQLYDALANMSEEDPLIQVIKDEIHHEIYIRIFGEVQKEVIEATLQENHGLDVRFSETAIICIERPAGTGHAVEIMGTADNPFYATVGLKVEPGLPGSGVTYRLEAELGSLPLSFHKAIKDTVFAVLKQGLYGWEVADIVVTLTHTGYYSSISTAGDFRKLVPLVLMAALLQAGTDVYEPINSFELSVPAGSISQAMMRLSGLQAVLHEPVLRKDAFVVTGTLPVAATEPFKRSLYSFTEGEGIITVDPGGFAKMEANAPTRRRTDYNPLNRKEYLLHVLRAY